jgi:UDP-N-acetylmuramyl pentapeptide synthase
LFQALPEDGVAIVNGDSEWCAYLSALAQCRVLSFGRTDADVLWSIESTDEFGVCTARFSYDGESIVATPIHPGEHMVANAAAAIAVGIACGMSLHDAGRGVGREATEWGRMVWLENSVGQRILDDTYNANEASMIAALRVLASADGERKVAVLGRMSEVTDERGAHQNVAALAKELNIQLLPYNTDLYGRSGLSFDQVINHLKSEKWDSLLVKGSRAAATEDVIVQLMNV